MSKESDENFIYRLADLIAYKVFYHVSDHERRQELRELLIQFAREIKRQAIEP